MGESRKGEGQVHQQRKIDNGKTVCFLRWPIDEMLPFLSKLSRDNLDLSPENLNLSRDKKDCMSSMGHRSFSILDFLSLIHFSLTFVDIF